MRVIVLGGSGNFGARICRALRAERAVELISASRTPVAHANGLQTVRLDMTSATLAADLTALRPDVVIHCVGPFQGQDYRVAEATLAAGAHYLDLADGRNFVVGFEAAIGARAISSDRLAVTGASTLPALSSAVIDSMLSRFSSLEEIDLAIAPGQRAARGLATLQAVFSYLGRPFPWLNRGRWVSAYGWQELRRLRFDCGTRWAAACDVPDLELLPRRYPGLQTVQFRAALELSTQHLGLWLLAALRRIGVPLPITRWAGGLDRVASLFDRFAGAFGGMRVSVVGTSPEGSRHRLTWHLTTPAADGPEIPCMAAILLTRRLAGGQVEQRGARICMGLLTLPDFESEFARWGIHTRLEESWA